jgi:hypothetical protein
MFSSAPPLDGNVNRGPTLLTISLVTTSIALLTTAFRIFVRHRIVHSIGWDDYTIVMAMVKISQTLHHTFLSADLKEVSALVASAINIPEVLLGTGRHEFYLNLHQIIESGKLNTLAQPWSIMSTCLSKVSVCLFLLRIIEHQNRNWDFFLCCLISLVVAVDCACSISILVQCQPLEKLWNPTVSGTCWPHHARNAMGYFQGSESPIPNLYWMLLTKSKSFLFLQISPSQDFLSWS